VEERLRVCLVSLLIVLSDFCRSVNGLHERRHLPSEQVKRVPNPAPLTLARSRRARREASFGT